MPDNQHVDSAASYDVATDKVTYSGDADRDVQLFRPVHVSGAEGSKTVVDVTDANGVIITDGGNSVTVDAPAGTPVFTRLSDGSAALIGQKAMAASLPVVIASDQSAVPVSNAIVEGAVYADDAARNKSLAIGAVLDDSSPTAITENQAGYLRMSSRRALLVEGVASGTAQPVSNAVIESTVYTDEGAFTVATSKVLAAGLHSVASGSAPDSTAADAAVNPVANRNRVPFVIGGDPGVITLKHTTITTAVTDAAIVTVGSGNKIVVTRLTVTLDNASTVFPTILIGFGTTNTPTTTGVLFAHGGIPAGGGANIGDGSGIIGIGADGEDLRVTTTGNATGNGVQITVTYYLVAG